MDEIDRKILKILRDNARITYVEIGRTVGLSEGAVRNRIQTLFDSGVIKRFTIDVATSVGVRALTMISINPSTPTSNVSRAVKSIPDVEIIYEITGGYDIVAVVSSPNIEGINHCIEEIRGIDGVIGTNTMIVLRTL